VATHIAMLKQEPCFANARYVLAPESNLANEAQEISEHMLRQFTGVSVLSQKTDRYGVLTSQDTKRKYVLRFADLLAHGAISYHEPLIAANPFVANTRPEAKAKAARMEFERQLRSFRRVHMLAPSLAADPYVVFTGKAGPDNKNTSRMKDDMVMSVLIGIYWSGQYLNGLVRERSYSRQLSRGVQALPIAPVVRHNEYGGQEFEERERLLDHQQSVIDSAMPAAAAPRSSAKRTPFTSVLPSNRSAALDASLPRRRTLAEALASNDALTDTSAAAAAAAKRRRMN